MFEILCTNLNNQKRKYKLIEDAVPTKFIVSKEKQKRRSSEMRQEKTKNKLLIQELDKNILGTATPDTVPPSSSNVPAHIEETILHETPHQLCMVSVSTQTESTGPMLECYKDSDYEILFDDADQARLLCLL